MKRFFAILVIALTVGTVATVAQRRISPVNNAATATQAVNTNRNENDTIDRSKLIKYKDDKGNVVLVDTVSGREIIDSTNISKVPPMIYPLIYETTIGVNVWDPLMRLFGQDYGTVGFSAELNMHNRYIAVFEAGLGSADNTPADNNFTYHSPIAPYFKIGLNYNFFYNSNPAYQLFAGVRYGFSPFTWTLRNVTPVGDYWGAPSPMQFPNVSATAGYLEFLVGLRVRIWRNISMGWTARFHSVIHRSATEHGKPWYVPGFGTYGSPLSASLSIFYTIPLHKESNPVIPQP
ncbi:MAG: hypothetical protein HDS75_03380 [Bacteroidales bacterium]|nr:hypothetical protein [Bacteroidales bacterium]